ncbi:hypothetical protein [Streptomyces sp. NPDC048277]|uniref:hypothetical protein n=1 Tax=Streptomyces sp. NPDC048277 TaxID=3155027 RepID=UPI0033DD4ECC
MELVEDRRPSATAPVASSVTMVSALAVQVLTGHWRVGAQYRKEIIELLGSPEWGLSDDALMAAVSGAGEFLRDAFDAELLRALLKLAEEGRGEYDDDLMQRLAVEAIARALGAGQAESMGPPEGRHACAVVTGPAEGWSPFG